MTATTNGCALCKVTTDHMRTAAVLMANGMEFHAARRSPERPARVEFTLWVRSEDLPKAKSLISACRHDLDVTVHLGAYERAFREIRGIIETVKENDNESAERGIPR